MINIAILVGNINYLNYPKLPCCHNDVEAVRSLLDATERYQEIAVIQDARADDLKARIRQALATDTEGGEVLFYFTGHGIQTPSDFYFCATDFEESRPNETGLSNGELHELLRSASPGLIIKITDACNSGTVLVKRGDNFLPIPKQSITNIIQIASCLDSQETLTGDPLSLFTEKFALAVLRKNEGPVYYTDIISTLRDDYLSNNAQTPHFVSQGTGRELFIEEAKSLSDFKAEFFARWISKSPEQESQTITSDVKNEPTLAERLRESDSRLATKESIESTVDTIFNGIKEKLSDNDITEYYTIDVKEHADFVERTTKGFIIRILDKEKRPDNFVYADIEKKLKKRNPFDIASITNNLFYTDEDYEEHHRLELNCKMKRVQIKFTLTPLFLTLKRITLVVTCAPSLDTCYLFELATEHSLIDFGNYDSTGNEVIRRWYKLSWNENTDGLTSKIANALKTLGEKQLDDVRKRLSSE